MKRLIAIGDIHGHCGMLVDLIDQLAPQGDDQLVFLGDYIDRGPQSPEVLDWLISFKQQHPQTVFLRGNHEQMLLDAVNAAERKLSGNNHFFDDFLALRGNGLPSPVFYFVACGGRETLSAYCSGQHDYDPCEVLTALPQSHLEFLQQTQFYYLRDGYMFVHAGVDPKDITGERRNNQAFLWQRKPLWKRDKNWDKIVVHGHTPVSEPYFHRSEINLDTGAGYGAYLTACDVLTRQSWHSAGDSD
jgi:serine/threonine protein phosphatase 1